MIGRDSLESDVAIARIVSSDVGRFLVNRRMTTVRDARTSKEISRRRFHGYIERVALFGVRSSEYRYNAYLAQIFQISTAFDDSSRQVKRSRQARTTIIERGTG